MVTRAAAATRSKKENRLLVQDDQPCLACGYNLRGLPIGGSCPECGAAMIFSGRNLDDPLNEMPTEILSAFLRGGIAGGASLFGMMGLIVSVFGGWITDARGLWIGALAVAAVWFVAVWWLTPAFNHPAARHHGFITGSRRRLAARLLQLGWLVLAFMMLFKSMIANAPAALETSFNLIALAGLVTGLVGLMFLSLVLEGLAEWVRDSTAHTAMNLMFWGPPMLLGGVATSWTLGVIAPDGLFSGLASIFALLVAAVGGLLIVIGYAWGISMLVRSIGMSVVHAIEFRNRTMRIAERRQEFAEAVQQRIEGMDAQ